MIPEEIYQKLREAYPFLKSLSESEAESIKQYSILKTLPAGETVFLKGDTCSFFAFILSGRVRVFKAGETGRDITLYRFEKGESCILTASCILSKNSFPAEAEVEEEIETVLIPNELLREFVKGYDPWRKYFFDLLSSRLSEVMEIVEEVAFRKMDSRIAEYITRNSHNGLLSATHQEIAKELGTSREVVSRILKDLEKEKIIILDRGKILINNQLALNSRLS